MEGTLADALQETLEKGDVAKTHYADFEIEAKIEGDECLLATTVFNGGNYMPPSIRRALGGRTALKAKDQLSEVCLTIDQAQFRVILAYRFQKKDQNLAPFLDDFLGVATEWRMLLDEYGQQDLIHIPI